MRMGLVALSLLGGLGLAACENASETGGGSSQEAAQRKCAPLVDGVVAIRGGTFRMGQSDVYAEEGPVRETRVDDFFIDRHEVTVAQFAAFVKATGYVTRAEKPVDPAEFGVPVEQVPAYLLEPGSAVFVAPDQPSTRYVDWWKYVPGASWRMPHGPGGAPSVPREPVVHLAFEDMAAYAAWRGGRLPTEAEWEFAARAGGPSVDEQPAPSKSNSWQGLFPVSNTQSDGFYGVAPVGCFDANAWGLYDMIGNVWEMTADFYRPGHDPSDRDNPQGPPRQLAFNPDVPGEVTRVMKGGSFLCAPNYCRRYRPAARQGHDPGLGASNIGFRLAYDRAPPAD